MCRPPIICLLLAFLWLAITPSPSLAQARGQDRAPTQLWKKFPFNQSGAQRGGSGPHPAGQSTHRARPSRPAKPNAAARRSGAAASGEPKKSSATDAVVPIALVLLVVLFVIPAGFLIAALRRRGKGPFVGASARALPRPRPRPNPVRSVPGNAAPNTPETGEEPRAAEATDAAEASPAGDRPDRMRSPGAPAMPLPAASAPPGGSADRPRSIGDRSMEEAGRDRSGEQRDASTSSLAAAVKRAPVAPAAGRAVGYASVAKARKGDDPELRAQAEAIERACVRRGLFLLQLLWDEEQLRGSDLERPGLTHALKRIANGEASCLVVSGLDRVSRSAADLGTLTEWLETNGTRLIAADLDLDTATPDGRLAARAVATVGSLERDRLEERTGEGLAAKPAARSSGRPAVADQPALQKRIRAMRAQGMTLQAIADTLNAERIPTLRGGAKWRPSSVHAATGYKRPRRKRQPKQLRTDR
jgi:DNA invertase Pin-like site-specific DNA recombinase